MYYTRSSTFKSNIAQKYESLSIKNKIYNSHLIAGLPVWVGFICWKTAGLLPVLEWFGVIVWFWTVHDDTNTIHTHTYKKTQNKKKGKKKNNFKKSLQFFFFWKIYYTIEMDAQKIIVLVKIWKIQNSLHRRPIHLLFYRLILVVTFAKRLHCCHYYYYWLVMLVNYLMMSFQTLCCWNKTKTGAHTHTRNKKTNLLIYAKHLQNILVKVIF